MSSQHRRQWDNFLGFFFLYKGTNPLHGGPTLMIYSLLKGLTSLYHHTKVRISTYELCGDTNIQSVTLTSGMTILGFFSKKDKVSSDRDSNSSKSNLYCPLWWSWSWTLDDTSNINLHSLFLFKNFAVILGNLYFYVKWPACQALEITVEVLIWIVDIFNGWEYIIKILSFPIKIMVFCIAGITPHGLQIFF